MLDFGITVMEETYGRERRHRWFTFKGYKALLNQENINEDDQKLSVDLANTGGFTDASPESFYDTLNQLHQHQDTDVREETTTKKRKPPKNPILPDGTVKRGRPRKRKNEDLGEDDGQDPPKRAKITAVGGDGVAEASTRRKRGRPPKRKSEDQPSITPTPRKRGRPPKNHTPATLEEQETQNGGEQTVSTIIPLSVSTQEVVPEIARDGAGLLALPHLEAFEQTIQRVATPEADILGVISGPQQTTPPESHFHTPESRESVQQDADGVRTSHRTRTQFTQGFIRTLQVSLSSSKLHVQ